jgi:hypothetical protein
VRSSKLTDLRADSASPGLDDPWFKIIEKTDDVGLLRVSIFDIHLRKKFNSIRIDAGASI